MAPEPIKPIGRAPGCPDGIAGLDLSRPAMLEASAGTGKTYAIEHLVLRLLSESEGLDLGQILVLTFTEKATGELKEKIRSRLAGRAAAGADLPPAVRARLREAVLNFDRACVFTIHGFCQRVLRNYAFENRALFHHELADDKDILAEVLTEEMRSTWLSDAGPAGAGLGGFRRLAARMGLNPSGKWKEKWLGLARSWNPFRGDRLLPEYDPGLAASLGEAISAGCAELAGLLGDVPAGEEKSDSAYLALKAAAFSPLNRKKTSLELLEALIQLAREIGERKDANARLERVRGFLNQHRDKAIVKEGFGWMAPASWPEGASPGRQRFESALACMDRLRTAAQARRQAERALDFDPERKVLEALKDNARTLKRERGVHSFDDMIQDLCEAIGERPELVEALRRQFRYCIVDEFQDTDALQWRIFRRVFLESDGSNPLFLIGDPKQAIYGFRGGDIHTYLEARNALFRLSRDGKAAGLGLDANFRSSRRMIEACNRIFTHPGWFRRGEADPGDPLWRLAPESDPRGYAEVRYGGLDRQECRTPALPGQGTGGGDAPIVLKDFTGETRKAPAQRKIHQWIVTEIASLIGGGEGPLLPDGNGAYRPADWGDICVLFRTGSEKKALEAAFRRSGIPFQVHKVPGLYRSDAAVHFLAVLKSLEEPADPGLHARALLTRFFRAPEDPLPHAPPSDIHPSFERWRRLADQRKWQRLIHAMLYDTGLVYRESLEPDGERRVMDFQHLGQNLVRDALKENLSLGALVERLKEGYAELPDEEDERHLHREDSESRKVALMTMHKSKGLEFPIVFLAALSEFSGAKVLRYHENGHTVFHLDGANAEASKAAEREEEDERRRLYYVALTRAKFRMYIPLPPPVFWKTPVPLGGFVADALRAACLELPGHFRMLPEGAPGEGRGSTGTVRPEAWSALAESFSPGIRGTESLTGTALAAAGADFSDFPPLAPFSGPESDFSSRRRRLSSYSLLVRNAAGIAAENLEGRYDKDEAPAEAMGAESASEGNPGGLARIGDANVAPGAPGNALPRGREIGNMFHAILEDADFRQAGKAPAPDALLADPAFAGILRERMEEYRLEPTHAGDVARVIWNTLRSPLPDAGGGAPFALADVAEKRPEMEFLFHHPSGGYLWGYIDLVFRHRGRFYLLDWKSNWLESYGRPEMEASMRESRYDLQYMLYAIALHKWLGSIVPGYDFERDFGGIYYLYLRGMGPEGAGAFAIRPTPMQIAEEYPARLDQALGAAGIRIPRTREVATATSIRSEPRS